MATLQSHVMLCMLPQSVLQSLWPAERASDSVDKELLEMLQGFKIQSLAPKLSAEGLTSTERLLVVLEDKTAEQIAAELSLSLFEKKRFSTMCKRFTQEGSAAGGSAQQPPPAPTAAPQERLKQEHQERKKREQEQKELAAQKEAAQAKVLARFPFIGADLANLHKTVPGKSTAGWTALHECAFRGDRDVAAALLELGAIVNAKTDSYKAAPLHYAARNGQTDLVELLLERSADINAQEIEGYTPCDRAKLHDHHETLAMLQRRGGDLNKRK